MKNSTVNNIDYGEPNLKKIRLSFSGDDAHLEQDFRKHHFNTFIHQMRYALAFGFVIYLLFGSLGSLVFLKDFAGDLLIIRTFYISPFYLVAFLLTYTKFYNKYNQQILFILILYSGFWLIYASTINSSYLSYDFYGELIFLMIFAYIVVKLRFIWSFIACWLIAISYILAVIFIVDVPLKQSVNYSIFFIIVNIFGMIAAYSVAYFNRKNFFLLYQLKKEREKVFSMNRELEKSVEKKTSELLKTNESLKLEIVARRFVEDEINKLNSELEQRVIQRTEQLQNALNELNEEVSVRKKAEADLIEAKEQVLEALNKEKELSELKSRFIANVSHEYRTPLTVVLSSTYLMEIFFEKHDKEKFLEQIKKIQYSVKDMTRLFDNAMTIEKSETKGFEPAWQEIDLLALLNDNINQAKTNDEKTHRFLLNTNVENINVKSDPKLLAHAFANIFDNAIKYSEKESEIKVSASDDDKSVEIAVENIGIGIPENEIGIIFEPFRRGSNVGAISGAGLGLTIAKRSLNSIHSGIEVHSLDGKTIFKVIIKK